MYQFVAILDAQGTLLEVNRAALEGAGLKLADVDGKPFWQCFWWAVSQQTQDALEQAVARCAQGEFVRYDVEIYGRAHGKETIIIDFSMIPVKDEAREVVFLVPEGRDITEKKAYEREIAKKNKDLQALLERIRELDEIKTQFFANVSHELRTPLQLIIGPADRLMKNDAAMGADQRQESARVIGRNARLLLKHVNDLLDISKFEAGKLKIELQDLDVAALIRFTASHFTVLAEDRKIAFLVEAPQEAVSAIDPEKLQRVLMNLLSNAFKFVPDAGKVRAQLRLSKKDLIVSIEDSGPGVKPELRKAIFERFRQGEGGTNRQFGGTGLGLAIAKEFVEMHKGTLEVLDSELGGACFQATLPISRLFPVAPASTLDPKLHLDRGIIEGFIEELRPSPSPTDEAKSITPINSAKSTVLVVEDNPEMNRFIAESLSDEYNVISAFDGQQGLEKALATNPTLIVSDIMMPKVSGVEMIAQMRKRPELADIPILLLSAKADEELKIKLLEEGAQDFVAKPFSEKDLLVRVRNLIGLKNSQERYGTLFKSMDQGFCTIEVFFDASKNPIDYRFLEVNAAFEKQTGLKDARGKRMRELAPEHEQHWFDIYGKIAVTGESRRFENRAEALGRWYEVYAFRVGRPEHRQVAVFFNDITERKRVEEASRESAQRLQLALAAGQLGDWSWEAATDLVTLSVRAAEIFGLSSGSTITWAEMRGLLHCEEREIARLAVEKALADKADYNVQYRIKRPPGWAWIAARGRGTYSNNAVIGMTGVVQDITAQKETEEALRQSEERFRASFNQAAVGMAIAGMDGRFEQVNERFSEILRYPKEELYRRTFRELTYPDDMPATEALMRRLMAGEIKEYVIEKRYRCKDGSLVWSLTTVTILRDVHGEPHRFIGIIEDITKRKQAEEGLRQSEEELRALANSIPQLAWMAEPDGHIFWYNRRWYEYTGSTLEQMLGWGWEKVHHSDHLPRVLYIWKQALASGRPWEDTFPLRSADGQYRWFLSRAFPIRDTEGKITRWFGTNTDVEEVKRTQDALSRAHEELELRVAERTAKLSEAVAQMEEFSYTVSHDLRAPLRGMQAYSKALLEDCSDILAAKPHALEYLQRIADNAARLDKMALDVLTFSRVARGELPLQPVSLDKLVRDLVEHYPAMRPPNAEIHIEPLADVLGHEPSLTQVMSNLLTNALKFVTPGTIPKVRVWTEKRDGEVRIWVEDSGVGIDPKYQHRLFRMFERIHPDVNYEGTGVGLAVVRKAAERMNGTVGVESDGKKGSRFWIQLRAV